MPASVNLVASEAHRPVANSAISELFTPAADERLTDARRQIGLLMQLDPEFGVYHCGLNSAFCLVLDKKIEPDSSREVSLFDLREVSDKGGISISENFACLRQAVTDEVTFNDEIFSTRLAVSRYRAQGKIAFSTPAHATHRLFEFNPEDSIVAVRAMRKHRKKGKSGPIETPHTFTYATKSGTLAFKMNSMDLLLSATSDAERADLMMQRFTGLLRIMSHGQDAPLFL